MQHIDHTCDKDSPRPGRDSPLHGSVAGRIAEAIAGAPVPWIPANADAGGTGPLELLKVEAVHQRTIKAVGSHKARLTAWIEDNAETLTALKDQEKVLADALKKAGQW